MKVTVVVPAHNEEGNIAELTKELKDALKNYEHEILLVDDNSTDATPKLCDEMVRENKQVKVIHRSEGRNGMGYALMEGTREARGEYVVWVMGDRSDKLESIAEMIDKLGQGYDMVVASRYMRGGSKGELAADKALYGSTYTTLARLVFGLRVHDITNAYRAFKKNILEQISLESGDFAISPEFAIKTHMHGYKVGEVPTTYYNRRAGQAKFNIAKMGVRYLSLFRLRFQRRHI